MNLAVTLAKIRQVTAVVINECKKSHRHTISAKIKPINVDVQALKLALRESLKMIPMGIDTSRRQT